MLSRLRLQYPKHLGRACGRGGMGSHRRRTRRRLRLENAVTRIASERASARRQASATYIHIKHPGWSMGGPCGFRIPKPGYRSRCPLMLHATRSVTSDQSHDQSFLTCPNPAKARDVGRGAWHRRAPVTDTQCHHRACPRSYRCSGGRDEDKRQHQRQGWAERHRTVGPVCVPRAEVASARRERALEHPRRISSPCLPPRFFP